FLFGAGGAGAFPGMSRAMYSWIPMRERGMVQGVNFSGSRIGAAITLPMVAWLIDQFGWRPTFAVLMMIGCVWAIAWFVFFRDDPDDASWLSDAEREHILQHRQSSSSDESDQDDDASSQGAASTSIYRSINVWMLSIQYFASNFIFFFGLTWFFPQLMTRYELSGLQASLFTAGPMVCGAIGNWTAGWLVDWMYRRGQWSWSRRLPAMIGFVLAAIGILGSITAQTPLSSSLWFCVCIFGADMTLSPSWSTCVDIGESRAGLVSGTMNMAGNVGSFVTSLAFPYLLQWTGSSQPFFFVAASLNFIAIAIWFRIDPTKPLDAAKS
ncbi:MAG: MFS transporter, partial [Planctomycetota bacterium]